MASHTWDHTRLGRYATDIDHLWTSQSVVDSNWIILSLIQGKCLKCWSVLQGLSTYGSYKLTKIMEKISWDAWSILILVFLTIGATFRQWFSNNNVPIIWTPFQSISYGTPSPPNNVEISNKEAGNTTLINIVAEGEGTKFNHSLQSIPTHFSMIVRKLRQSKRHHLNWPGMGGQHWN